VPFCRFDTWDFDMVAMAGMNGLNPNALEFVPALTVELKKTQPVRKTWADVVKSKLGTQQLSLDGSILPTQLAASESLLPPPGLDVALSLDAPPGLDVLASLDVPPGLDSDSPLLDSPPGLAPEPPSGPPPGLSLPHTGHKELHATLLAQRQALLWAYQQQLALNTFMPPGYWNAPCNYPVTDPLAILAQDEAEDDKIDLISEASTEILSHSDDDSEGSLDRTGEV